MTNDNTLGRVTRQFSRQIGRRLKSFFGPSAAGMGSTFTVIRSDWNGAGFQTGAMPPQNTGMSGTTLAAIGAYVDPFAQMPCQHMSTNPDGSWKVNLTTKPGQLMHRPNPHMTGSMFFATGVQQLLTFGNFYFFAKGGTKKAPDEIYILPHTTQPVRVRDQATGETEIYYNVPGSPFTEMIGIPVGQSVMIPERLIGHVRINAYLDPLVGVSPLVYAASSNAANNAINGSMASFFSNMSRPSGVLTTDLELKRDQMKALREAWNEQSSGFASGGVPILAGGLKWDPMSTNADDAQLVESYRLTVEEIARVFGVPLPLISAGAATAAVDLETNINMFLGSGLGKTMAIIEAELARFFDLPLGQFMQFDTSVLIRTNIKTKFEALSVGTRNGILSHNEARAQLGLPPVEGGYMPRVQAQNIPLDAPITIGGQPVTPVPEDAPAPVPEDDDKIVHLFRKSVVYREALDEMPSAKMLRETDPHSWTPAQAEMFNLHVRAEVAAGSNEIIEKYIQKGIQR